MLRAFIQSLAVLEFHDQEEPTSPSIYRNVPQRR